MVSLPRNSWSGLPERPGQIAAEHIATLPRNTWSISAVYPVSRSDLTNAFCLLDKNIEWNQPGNNRISGFKKGIVSIKAMLDQQAKLADHILNLTSISSVSIHGDAIACVVHWNAAQPPGGILDVDNIDIFTVKNGKITKVDVFSANQDMEDNFWGKIW